MPVCSALAAVAVALALCGCGDATEHRISRWRLSGDVAPVTREVTLPSHLPVASHAGTYRLDASVTIPAGWHGRALTLWVAELTASATLYVDGVVVPTNADAVVARDHRAIGPASWPVTAEATADGQLALSLVIDHRWTQSGWWASTPRLTVAGDEPASTTYVRWINVYVAIAALISLIQLGLTSLMVYWVDRNSKAYLWFGYQLATAAAYPAYSAGVTQTLFGEYEVGVLGAMISTALATSIWFTHYLFGLAKPWRGWAWLWGVAVVLCLAFAGPFTGTPVAGTATVVLLGSMTCYQLIICARLSLRHEERATARFQLASWAALGLTTPVDGIHWLGWLTIIDGMRPASLGLMLFALCQSLVLARRHIISLRVERAQRAGLDTQKVELVRLNEELRHQVAQRSSQLYAALALVGAPRTQSLELRPGEVIAQRYRIVQQLGRGGMGIVYEVERISDEKHFALKLTREHHGTALARLAREAAIASRVVHDNLVRVIDVSVAEGGFLFTVMELVDGKPLNSERERWGDVGWALPILAQIADGVVALHAAGVVHRDLKPANILLATDGAHAIVKITDFGVSRATTWFGSDESSPSRAQRGSTPEVDLALASRSVELTGVLEAAPTSPPSITSPSALDTPASIGSEPSLTQAAAFGAVALDAALFEEHVDENPRSPSPQVLGTVTKTGLLVGTPPYIPPEMSIPHYTPQPSADIFALGVIAFELCTGVRPWRRPAVVARLAGEDPGPAPSLATLRPDVPVALVALVARCLEVDPAKRPDAATVARTLREVASHVAVTPLATVGRRADTGRPRGEDGELTHAERTPH